MRSSIKFAIRKIKPGSLPAGTVKNNLEGTVERFATRDSVFSLINSIKGTPAYWKQFLFNVLWLSN